MITEYQLTNPPENRFFKARIVTDSDLKKAMLKKPYLYRGKGYGCTTLTLPCGLEDYFEVFKSVGGAKAHFKKEFGKYFGNTTPKWRKVRGCKKHNE